MKTKTVLCNECRFSKYRAGISSSLAAMYGLPGTHPYPTHTCEKYNVVRERKDYHVRRLPICAKENGGEQKDKKGNEDV